jgi:hypothetical protein
MSVRSRVAAKDSRPSMQTASVSALRYLPIEGLALAALIGLGVAFAVGVPALRRGDLAQAIRSIAVVLLMGAVAAMLVATMSTGSAGGSNWIPGAGIRSAIHNVNRSLGLVNLIGNVAMFMPIGFLLPLASRLRFTPTVAVCALMSALVELQQLTAARSLDVDDVLLNTVGGAVGGLFGIAAASPLVRATAEGAVPPPAAESTVH